MSDVSDKIKGTLSRIKSQSSIMLWIWNPEPKKGGRGRAQVNSRFGEFCIFVFKISKYEIKVIKVKSLWTLNSRKSENVSKCWFHVSSLLVSSQQVLDSPFYFLIVKKCRFFPFIVLKSTDSDSPFIFPKHTEYTPVPRMVENENYLSQV